jgi:hypothetical protein
MGKKFIHEDSVSHNVVCARDQLQRVFCTSLLARFLLLVCFVRVGAMEAAATAVTPPSLREQGNALFKEKNYLKTAAVYTQAIKADPENATVYRCVF